MLELDPTDITYTFAPLALIAAIVPLLGIINASLPTMRPALEEIFGPKWNFGSTGGSSGRRRWYKYHSKDARHVSGTEESNDQRRNSDTEFPLVTIGGTLNLRPAPDVLQSLRSESMLTIGINSEGTEYGAEPPSRHGRIKVTRDWEVSSAHSEQEVRNAANVSA